MIQVLYIYEYKSHTMRLLFSCLLFVYSFALTAQDTILLQSLEQNARRTYRGKVDSSLFYAQQIINSCTITDAPQYHAFALNWKGICFMGRGEHDSAEVYYSKTIDYGTQNQQEKYVRMARLNRSINAFQQGLFEEAAKAADEARKAFELAGDTLGVAHAQYNLGNCLFRLERYNEALTFYYAAREVYQSKGSVLNRANLANAIGSVYNEQKEHEKAIKQYNQSVEEKKAVGGEHFCAAEYINIANAYIELNQQDSVFFYYKKAAEMARLIGDKGKLGLAYLNLSKLFDADFKADSALHYGKLSKQIGEETNDNFLIYSSWEVLASAYRKTTNYKAAYDAFLAYNVLKDSINTVEIQERVSELEKQFQLAEKEKVLLRQEAEIQQQKLTTRIQLLLIALLIFILIVAAMWYKRRKQLQALKHQQALNGERSRIAMDLHDHLGAELTLITSQLDTQVYTAAENREKQKLQEIAEQVRTANSQLRETVWSIRNESIDAGQLISQIQSFGEKMLADSSIKGSYTTSQNEFKLAPHVALTLFRISQEAITNAFKYANASTIEVRFKVLENHFALEISDNGTGFNPDSIQKGYGLSNMKTRATQINCQLELITKEGKGSSVRVVS